MNSSSEISLGLIMFNSRVISFHKDSQKEHDYPLRTTSIMLYFCFSKLGFDKSFNF